MLMPICSQGQFTCCHVPAHGRLRELSQHTAGRNAFVDFATQRTQSSEDISHGEILQVLLVASESAPGPVRIEGVLYVLTTLRFPIPEEGF